jgi:hypothetical protein
MSERNPEEILKVLEEQALEDEMREVAKTSDADLDDELRKAGIDPGRAVKHAAPPQRAPRVPATWVALVAAVSAAAALLAWEGPELVARWTHPPAPTPVPHEERPPEPTLAERVSTLRDEAGAACSRDQWSLCLEKLDEAASLDPQGDRAPNVRRWRQEAYDGLRPDADLSAKPRVP